MKGRRAQRARCSASVVVAALLLATGCPDRAAQGTFLSSDTLAERLLDDRARRIRMQATVAARSAGLTGFLAKAELDVAAERPARLHLSARSFFGQPLFAVLTDGETLTLYDARDGTAVFGRGEASRASLARLVGLPLAPSDVVDLLLGGAPHLPSVAAREVRVDGERAILSGTRDDGLTVSIVTRRTDDTILAVTLGSGASAVHVTMAEHSRVDGFLMPGLVEITWHEAQEERRVRLTVGEVRLNGEPLGDEAFLLSPPEGVEFGPLP
jgi:hypothetical protein